MAERILILGAGFGGVYAAKALARHVPGRVTVEIIDDNNYFVFQPLLPEVAGGLIAAEDAVTPLRQMLPFARTREAEVVGIDFAARRVEVIQGKGRVLAQIPYDQLVLAPGQRTDLSRYPGLSDHAFTMKDLTDAHRLRNQVLDCLEEADIAIEPRDRARFLTFVVIGGGLSGVETMGEIEEMVHRSLRFYPRIGRNELRFVLAEFAPRILAELPDQLADYARALLRRRGIEIRTGMGVDSAAQGSVTFGDGTTVHAETVVATIGNGPTAPVSALPLPKERGKIAVDRSLRVPGFDGVWALGDAAAVPQDKGFAPPTAQSARQQAAVLGANLIARLEGRPLQAFTFRRKGQLASLGGRRGVAELLGRQISGWPAWVLWRSVYLALLPSASTKVRVAADWLRDVLLPRNIVQVQQGLPPAVQQRHYRAGDVVFRRGEVTGDFYMVVSGSFIRTDERGQAAPLGPGSHFGEGTLLEEKVRRSTVVAREPSVCLALRRADVDRLANCSDGLTLFKDIRRQRAG